MNTVHPLFILHREPNTFKTQLLMRHFCYGASCYKKLFEIVYVCVIHCESILIKAIIDHD